MSDFKGKRILIDGGASGIGLQCAIQLTVQGAKVILLDIDPKKLKEALSLLRGEENWIYAIDMSRVGDIESSVNEIIKVTGPLDGFVHCVGVRCRRPLKMLKAEIVSDVMRVNFGSFIELTRCLTKRGNFNPGMSIVAISSISAKTGGAAITAYAASKAALDGAVRCLAKELGEKGIRINTVMPGQINTPTYSRIIGDSNDDLVLQRQYLGLGQPSDVANAVMFLLSNKSHLITGASIPLDGGFFTS